MKKSKPLEPKLMYAIVTKDEKGQTIQLFKEKKFAEEYYKTLKKIYVSEG